MRDQADLMSGICPSETSCLGLSGQVTQIKSKGQALRNIWWYTKTSQSFISSFISILFIVNLLCSTLLDTREKIINKIEISPALMAITVGP